MPLWEYKVITSGKGGFATPALLEKFLNDLGREEWEIIEFRTAPDNALAFTGLARRTTQRDWTLEDAAAAAARAEAEKLRAEFAAKFQAATSNASSAEERAPSFLEEKLAPDDGFRKPIDTSRDDEPEGAEEEKEEKDEWDRLEQEDELPTFFDAMKPHMRRNQRGPGTSVGVDYLAKKWGLDESDIKGALVECGFQIPADENAKPVYIEYDGDLYWVNINRRGEVWINEREKPRPVFRVVQGNKVAPEAPEEPTPEPKQPKPETVRPPRSETVAAQPEMPEAAPAKPEPARSDTPAAPMPQGAGLLDKIRPLMRRNRRGSGGSGSASFLARALKCSEADLIASFTALGLAVPATAADQPVNVEIGSSVWWLNKDSRGGIWINGRDKREGEVVKPAGAEAAPGSPESAAASVAATEPSATPAEPASSAAVAPETGAASSAASAQTSEMAPASAPESPLTAPASPGENAPAPAVAPGPNSPFGAVRPLLKETRTGGLAGKVERVAGELGKSPEDLVATLVGVGLKVPEKPREKPVFVEHAGEIYWFNLNAKNELWVNAKASKFAESDEGGGGEDSGEKRPARRSRGRGRGASSGDSGATSGENPPAAS